MKNFEALRRRYGQDAPAVQLGGLASNLSRVAWHAQHGVGPPAPALFRESKSFTEWAAPNCSLEQQVSLAEVQLSLALWERGWGTRIEPATIAQEAQRCAAKLLASAGLLTE